MSTSDQLQAFENSVIENLVRANFAMQWGTLGTALFNLEESVRLVKAMMVLAQQTKEINES